MEKHAAFGAIERVNMGGVRSRSCKVVAERLEPWWSAADRPPLPLKVPAGPMLVVSHAPSYAWNWPAA